MTSTQKDKLLRFALTTFGVIFCLIYPVGMVWPSGWVWHGGRSGEGLRVQRRHEETGYGNCSHEQPLGY